MNLFCVIIITIVMAMAAWIYWRMIRENSKVKYVSSRPVGSEEMVLLQRNARMSNAFKIISKHPLSFAMVKKATTLVANSQPLMKTCIQLGPGHGERLWFVPMKKLVYDIQEKPNIEWKVELKQQLLMPYNIRNGPLWRLAFLPNIIVKNVKGHLTNECTLVFACHHTIADGMSVMRIMAQVINTVNKIMSGTTTSNLPEKIMYASTDELIGSNLGSLKEYILQKKAQVCSFFPRICQKQKKKDSKLRDFSELDNVLNVLTMRWFELLYLELSREETNRLLTRCRCKGATILGVAMAASNVAINTIFLRGNFQNIVMADSRKFLKIPDEAIGQYPYAMHIPLKMTKGQQVSFWEDAKLCSKVVHERINRETCIEYFYRGRQEKRAPTDLLSIKFSNRGNCNFVNENCSYVKAVASHGAVAAKITIPICFGNIITTVDGRLCWTLKYNMKYASTKEAEQVRNAIKSALIASSLG